MSQVLDRIRQAEEERERVIAERRRIEAEADSALAEHEREEALRRAQAESSAPPLPPAVHTRAVQEASARRTWGTVAAAVAVACAFWLGTRVQPSPPAAPAPAQAVTPVAAPTAAPVLFRLDADSEAFAARAASTERK
jgi:uncharacterized membrane protein YccC